MDTVEDAVQNTPSTAPTQVMEQSGEATDGDVVVGYDGTGTGDVALDWAAQEARSRGARLRVVCANPFAQVDWAGFGAYSVPPVSSSEYVDRIAAQGHDRARQILDEQQVASTKPPAGPVPALVHESQSAALVVLGHRSRNRLGEIVAGSVVSAVTTHADCDVVVVPRGDLVLPGPGRPVVVGVDGAADGDLAADRAAQYALRWGAALEIVQAWRMSKIVGWPEGVVAPDDGIIDQAGYVERRATESVQRVADSVRAKYPGLTVRTIVIEEHPARALADIAATAGLLVVGTRGLGGFERLILGSTSRAVVHHATVPVVVVRR